MRACVVGSPPIHAPALALLWGSLGLWAWHGMAEVTRDDGTAASAQGRESLGLEVWERKQRLGKVYALDETPNSRNRVRERVCAMG